MSNISEEGLKQVDAAFADATKDYDRIANEMGEALKKMIELSHAMECTHDELEDAGSLSLMKTRCKKCNFVWQE